MVRPGGGMDFSDETLDSSDGKVACLLRLSGLRTGLYRCILILESLKPFLVAGIDKVQVD